MKRDHTEATATAATAVCELEDFVTGTVAAATQAANEHVTGTVAAATQAANEHVTGTVAAATRAINDHVTATATTSLDEFRDVVELGNDSVVERILSAINGRGKELWFWIAAPLLAFAIWFMLYVITGTDGFLVARYDAAGNFMALERSKAITLAITLFCVLIPALLYFFPFGDRHDEERG